jgi:hypothetical protein
MHANPSQGVNRPRGPNGMPAAAPPAGGFGTQRRFLTAASSFVALAGHGIQPNLLISVVNFPLCPSSTPLLRS